MSPHSSGGVVAGGLAAHPAAALQAVHDATHATERERAGCGQVTDAEAVARRLGQEHERRLVAHRQALLANQVGIQRAKSLAPASHQRCAGRLSLRCNFPAWRLKPSSHTAPPLRAKFGGTAGIYPFLDRAKH